MNTIFRIVAGILLAIAKITGLTYNQINIIVYYFIIPFSWFWLLDIIFQIHFLKVAFIGGILGFFIGCRDFKSYSDWLFKKSVLFLKYFNRFGSNYVLTSVLLCVVFPIIIYVLLLYEIHLID